MRCIALVVGVAALAVPGTAQGALFCVNKPPCAGGTTVTTFKAAVDGANGTTTDPVDRIELGAGDFAYTTAPNASAVAGQGLDIVGAGRDQTFLLGGGAGTRVLTAGNQDTLISDLTVELQSINNVEGLFMAGGRLERVDV